MRRETGAEGEGVFGAGTGTGETGGDIDSDNPPGFEERLLELETAAAWIS